MLGAGNQNVFGHSSLTKRPASIGEIIGHKIKVRKKKSSGNAMVSMLSRAFSPVASRSPQTIVDRSTYPGIPKVE
jgi:hypothetical protein